MTYPEALAIAARNGHQMVNEQVRQLGNDRRVSSLCDRCGRRLIGITQGTRPEVVDGTALTSSCEPLP